MYRFSLGIIVSGLLAVSVLQGATVRRTMRVAAPQAELFDAPQSDAHVITSIPRGTKLVATGPARGDWVEVEAPASVSGWIFGELLRDGLVSVTSVKIRSGPGIEYGELGRLHRGDQVRIKRKAESGWVEFEGLPVMKVWVEQSMVSEPAVVQLAESAPTVAVPAEAPAPDAPSPPPVSEQASNVQPAAQAAADAETSPAAPQRKPEARRQSPRVGRTPAAKTPARRLVPAVPPATPPARRFRSAPSAPSLPTPPPSQQSHVAHRPLPAFQAWEDAGLSGGWRPVPMAPQGRRVSVEGELRSTGFALLKPSAYRIVQRAGLAPAKTSFYLHGDEDELKSHRGQRVRVQGYRYWLVGVREPIVVVTRIQ